MKLGGSLLNCPHTVADLEQWLAAQSPQQTLLIVGGGELADAVRCLDRNFGWDPTSAHVQAVQAMQLNAYVVCQQSARLHWVRRLDDLAATSARATLPLPCWFWTRCRICCTTSRSNRELVYLWVGT